MIFQLSQVIPAETKIFAQFADVLPADGDSPVYPFGGFVLNFNVATKIHRDPKDKGFCVILVISEECGGGELCLEELGIKCNLRNGDVIIFRSHKISHFNMHFEGERASIVLHTDGDGDSWVKFRNHWKKNLFMVQTENGGGELQKYSVPLNMLNYADVFLEFFEAYKGYHVTCDRS